LNFYNDYYLAAAQGAVLVTVNRRLTRALHKGYAEFQKLKGEKVWQSPDIIPWEAWLLRCLAQTGDDGRYLNSAQAECLWQEVIRADLAQHNYALLQLAATAKMAARAHRLTRDFHCGSNAQLDSTVHSDADNCYLPADTDDWWSLSAEHKAFLRWQTAFLARCEQGNWLDDASLAAYVIAAFAAGDISAPKQLVLLGFDTLTPMQSSLLQQLSELGGGVTIAAPATTVAAQLTCTSYADERAEIAAAAKWARACLENQVGRVAIVVPDLERLHSSVERIFRRELHQTQHHDLVPTDTFNVSLGQPLALQGMVTSALAVLTMGAEVDFATISYLLRSPWLWGAGSDAGSRGQLECWLRQKNICQITISELIELCQQRGAGGRAFGQLLMIVRTKLHYGVAQSLVQWGDTFNTLLQQVGWPGQRALNSADYQVLSAWREKLLPAFAALHVVHASTKHGTAAALLQKLANELLFQPQAQDDRLQVSGILETAGLHFDALWVMGLSDQVLPGHVQYNPFLPVTLQRDYAMPHSSIEHENAYAQLTLQRLLCSAPQVVLSFPQADGSNQLNPSPYIAQYLIANDSGEALDHAEQPGGKMVRDDWEYLADGFGAVLLATTADGDDAGGAAEAIEVRGGTSVLKEQAICPFRAYGHQRLQARGLETPQPGLDGRLRGALLHEILEQFWCQVKDHQQLCAFTEAELSAVVATITAEVLQKQHVVAAVMEFFLLEQTRLTRIIIDWLLLFEKPRQPFTVVASEEQGRSVIGPLALATVPDRIDALADGSHVVIDYKSALVSVGDLVGKQLLEPQLPIYALSRADLSVVAIAFAQIRAGECAFKGVATEDGILAGVKSVAKSGSAKRDIYSWPELMADWDWQLERLAQQFSQGQAEVQPYNQTACQFCDLHGLCRIAAGCELGADDDAGVL